MKFKLFFLLIFHLIFFSCDDNKSKPTWNESINFISNNTNDVNIKTQYRHISNTKFKYSGNKINYTYTLTLIESDDPNKLNSVITENQVFDISDIQYVTGSDNNCIKLELSQKGNKSFTKSLNSKPLWDGLMEESEFKSSAYIYVKEKDFDAVSKAFSNLRELAVNKNAEDYFRNN